jgi:hypothetical protein
MIGFLSDRVMERLMVGLPRDKVRVFLASTLVVAIAISVVGVVASIRQASEVSDVRARLAATGQELSKVKATIDRHADAAGRNHELCALPHRGHEGPCE